MKINCRIDNPPKYDLFAAGRNTCHKKETNRILFGVANAINTNNGPDGRIYYYTSCDDLNYGNTRQDIKFERVLDTSSGSNVHYKCKEIQIIKTTTKTTTIVVKTMMIFTVSQQWRSFKKVNQN